MASPVQIQMSQQTPPPPTNKDTLERYLGKPAIVLGILEIVLAVLCVGSNSAGLGLHAFLMEAAHGFWGGVYFGICGVVTIFAGLKKCRLLITVSAVLNGFVSLLALVMVILSSIGMGVEPENPYYEVSTEPATTKYYYWRYDYDTYYDDRNLSSRIATNAILLAAILLQWIISIIVLSFGCHVLCCCVVQEGVVLSSQAPTQALMVVGQPGGQNVQLLVVQGQPGVPQTVQTQSAVQIQQQNSLHAAPNEGYEVPVRQTNSLGPPGYNAPPPPTETRGSPPQYEGLYDVIDQGGYERVRNTDYINE